MKCSTCGAGPFKGQQGLSVHNIRTKGHPGYRGSWGTGNSLKASKTSKGSKSVSGRFPLSETIHQVLAKHPDGLSVRDLSQKVIDEGYKNSITTAIQRVSTSVYNSKRVKRVGKKGSGIYKLIRMSKQLDISDAPPQTQPQPETDEPMISRDALEIQLAQQTNKARKLRGIIDDLLDIALATN